MLISRIWSVAAGGNKQKTPIYAILRPFEKKTVYVRGCNTSWYLGDFWLWALGLFGAASSAVFCALHAAVFYDPASFA